MTNVVFALMLLDMRHVATAVAGRVTRHSSAQAKETAKEPRTTSMQAKVVAKVADMTPKAAARDSLVAYRRALAKVSGTIRDHGNLKARGNHAGKHALAVAV